MYAISQGLKPDGLFKVIDQNFDGVICEQDIQKFINEILKPSDYNPDNNSIQRIIKLISVNKSNTITKSDIYKLLNNS